MNNLLEYLDNQKIQYSVHDELIVIDNKICWLVKPNRDNLLFNDDFELIQDYIDGVDYYLFQFGGQWYYSDSVKKPQLNVLKYLGIVNQKTTPIQFLGVHGGFELLNGSRSYDDWCKKARFLDVNVLGICEKNTLAGVLKFQLSCLDNKIKPIIGATYTIDRNDFKYDIKCYVKNEKGWNNLLQINKHVRVLNNGFIKESDFFKLKDGLFIVIDPKSIDYKDVFPIDLSIDFYYQLDSVEYSNNERDRWYLNNLKRFIDSDYEPILICDAYYLDKEDFEVKEKLNTISGKREYKSNNQYFKNLDDIYKELQPLFKNNDVLDTLLGDSISNLNKISTECNFLIKTNEKYLPKYIMTEEEKSKFKTNEDLFWSLIQEGLVQKIDSEKYDIYIDRIEREVEVIQLGGYIDYFLILWDIIKWSRENDILVGMGRGSAGGTLVGYLLGIHYLDPLKYNLLFERFLNKGRIKTSIPDIDCDFQGSRRNEVKSYMENRYGKDQVCSVGTYGTYQMKALLKELARLDNFPHHEMNRITNILDLENGDFVELFKNAVQKSSIRSYIQNHIHSINIINNILYQPKNESIHACATLILPEQKDVYSWIPVKWGERDGEKMVVTEWEGNELEKAGFLKEDILGIQQLDKFANILKLIKQNCQKDIDIYNLPLDDDRVYKFFKNGWNGDIFHFGSKGLTEYCKMLQPETVEDLIAGIALYRPGAMESNFHNEYVFRSRKYIESGKGREIEYFEGCEKITQNTRGLIVYQEQIMQICQELAGFSLEEADDIRKGMGKKIQSLINEYGEKFISRAVINGYSRDGVEKLWGMMKEFAKYAFNRCISGNERLYRVKNGSNFSPTIKQMYDIKNNIEYAKSIGKKELHQRYKHLGYGCGFSLNENNRLVKNKIKDIRYEGIQSVYRLELESGEFIDTTNNHKFPTSNGDKILKDIDISNDLIYINGGYEKDNTDYRFTNKGELNNERYHSNDKVYKYVLNSEKGKEGFQKKKTPYTQLQYYKKNLKRDFCEICNKDNCKLEVHHKNNNHGDSNFDNLMTVCVSCHKKEHYKLGRVRFGEKGLLTRLIKIKSINYIGVEDVYDVEMEHPYHNFTTNQGIVTCNSHATAYAINGYISQWLKVNYPLEFWVTAFSYASEEDYPRYIFEIFHSGNIKLLPPHINKSGKIFGYDIKQNSLYWSLSSIKQLGEKAIEEIEKVKQEGGEYFSFEEFVDRHKFKGSAVNKAVIENMIICGVFDELEGISHITDRYNLILKYREIRKLKVDKDDMFDSNNKELKQDWWWSLKQKQLCGFVFLPYSELIKEAEFEYEYMDPVEFTEESSIGKEVTIGGYVMEIDERVSKKGDEYAKLLLESNYEFIEVTIWNDQWKIQELRDSIIDSEKKILLISGQVKDYRGSNTLQLTENSDFLILE